MKRGYSSSGRKVTELRHPSTQAPRVSEWSYRAYTQRASVGWTAVVESSSGSDMWGACSTRHFWTERAAVTWGIKQLAKKRAAEACKHTPRTYLEPTERGEYR